MTIKTSSSKLHWNYFLALERDMDAVSRFVEFESANFKTYSIELAHMLFAAASEADVVAKLVCEQVDPKARRYNIEDYKSLLLPAIPTLPTTKVFVPRYGLTLEPWSNWAGGTHPDWWDGYNKVKHHRSSHFDQATLENALNAMAGLLVITYEYYACDLSPPGQPLHVKAVTAQLEPTTALFRFADDWYHGYELRE